MKNISIKGAANAITSIAYGLFPVLGLCGLCLDYLRIPCNAIKYCLVPTAVIILLHALYLLMFNRIRFDRIISDGRFLRVMLVMQTILAVPVALYGLLSLTGIRADALMGDNSPTEEISRGLLWTIYYQFIDAGNQYLATTAGGRLWVAVIALLGCALMSGMLVAMITNMLDRRASDFDSGTCRYTPNVFGVNLLPSSFNRFFFGRYAVIIGGHSSAIDICRRLQREGTDHIFILTSSDIPTLRANLRSARDVDESRIVLYFGNRADSDEIAGLYLSQASEIHILGENNEGANHDVLNMRCLQLVAAECSSHAQATGRHKPCYVLFDDQTTFSVFQSSGTPGVINNCLAFYPYNYFENWAQRVLVHEAGKEYLPLEGDGLGAFDNARVHFIIVGMTRMGLAMAVEAAHITH